MTRVAVVADIHANPFALEAVLADIDDVGVDEILVNGDLVGRGPMGSAVVGRIRELGLRSTRGNHEDYLISFRRREVPEEWLELEEWACHRWMTDELTDADVEFLDTLPFTLTSDVAPSIRLYHGSPRSHTEGLGEWTGDTELRAHLDSVDEPTLVVAHTHRPLVWRCEAGCVINVGSVGLPFNGDPRAQYAVLTVEEGDVAVELRQVDYDQEAFLQAYETTGFIECGGATARLLRMEVRAARPHLVPFLKWSEARGRAPVRDALPEFLEVFDPGMSLAEFVATLDLDATEG